MRFVDRVAANPHETHPDCRRAQIHFARNLVGSLFENVASQHDFSRNRVHPFEFAGDRRTNCSAALGFPRVWRSTEIESREFRPFVASRAKLVEHDVPRHGLAPRGHAISTRLHFWVREQAQADLLEHVYSVALGRDALHVCEQVIPLLREKTKSFRQPALHERPSRWGASPRVEVPSADTFATTRTFACIIIVLADADRNMQSRSVARRSQSRTRDYGSKKIV
jgi:hypothetical protein